jgi:hypothetical protein
MKPLPVYGGGFFMIWPQLQKEILANCRFVPFMAGIGCEILEVSGGHCRANVGGG